MTSHSHFILVGNYARDRQESMIRFHDLLADVLRESGIKKVETLKPEARLGRRFASTNHGLGKLAGYVDKYVLFPRVLRREARLRITSGALFHICDHSNAPYISQLPQEHTAITCHDLLAVRGGLGDAAACCPASRTGSILQRWILSALKQCPNIICDSEATRQDLLRLTGRHQDENIKTVHLALNDGFRRVPREEGLAQLTTAGIPIDEPYILHVGSGLPRKNRAALIKTAARSKQLGLQVRIVIAGAPATQDLLKLGSDMGIRDLIHGVHHPDFNLLNILYSNAHALVFPSYSEGFGWPPLEAQASGCPVISSNRTSLAEICGTGAILSDPDDIESMATAVLRLGDPAFRTRMIDHGLRNLERFSRSRMREGYLDFYRRMEPKMDHLKRP